MTPPADANPSPAPGVPVERPRLLRRVIWRIGHTACYLVMVLLFGLRRRGTANLPRHGPVLVVSNHQSHLDPVAVGECARRREMHFVARDSLFRVPILGPLIRVYNAIPIKRGAGDAAGVRAVLERLQRGAAVLVFPEGTRSNNGALGEFKRGVALLIKRAGCPVVPAAVDGAFEVWPRKQTLPRPFAGRILVALGPPIDPADLLADGPDAAIDRLRREIESLQADLRRERQGRRPGRAPAADAA